MLANMPKATAATAVLISGLSNDKHAATPGEVAMLLRDHEVHSVAMVREDDGRPHERPIVGCR